MFNIYAFKLFKLICLILFVTTAAQKSSDFKYLGCYLEENLVSLGEENHVLTPVSPKSCSEYCSEKQYLFFILKNDVCYCSKNYISRLMKQLDQDCTKKCSGDTAFSCGGVPNLVSFYITNSSKSNNIISQGGFPISIYLGCYSETPNDDENRLLKGPAQPYSNNTPQRCSEICFKMGYIHFGVTYGTECWCGNQKPTKTAKVEDVNCNTPCAGDSKQFCGGGWKMSIYSTGITDYVPKKYVGCFEDEDENDKGRNIIIQMGTNNSPKRCMNLCNIQQFRYAVVKGSVCTCKNTEPNYSLKRSFSDCNTLCQENPSEYCGGSVTTSIYKTLYSDPQGNMEMSYLGCYNNLKRHPAFNGWKITFTRLTPKHCVNSCFARRFPYAALTSSRECSCSFVKPSSEAKTEENICTIPCSGSSQHTCGGNNAVSVYNTGLQGRTDEIGNYYLGCFEESQTNRIFNGYSRSHSTNTPDFCSSLCYKFGYPYSGVTYKSECFCGSQPPSEPKFPKVDDKQCNTKCTGDANQYCGGGWRMGVFATGLRDFQVDERSIGCYIIQENTLNNMKFELINTNKPSTCSAICNNAGYQFAGLAGINCLCGNRAPDNDQKVDNSECDTSCIGDSSRTCGGEDRIEIFDLTKQINKTASSDVLDLKNRFDDFDSFNLESLWSHEVYIPQEPDFEFNVFNKSTRNVYVNNSELVIKPTILTDHFVKRGSLTLTWCTKNKDSNFCNKNATSFNIIPPIILGKITTKDHLSFLYGQLEVVAKFPSGDWLVSEIALVSKSNEQNKLILATVFGNTNLKCNNIDESSKVVKYGLKIDKQYHITSNMMKSTSNNHWTNDYHSFILSWTHENIVVKIDGESNYLDTSNLPLDIIFDAEYYISIGVSVGGLNSFLDDCVSNGRSKPWNNTDPKASLTFWKDKNKWLSTWGEEKSTLRIKSLKFTAFDNNN